MPYEEYLWFFCCLCGAVGVVEIVFIQGSAITVVSASSVATRSACYRGPKPQDCPKWLGEGAKGVLVYVHQKPVALVQKTVGLVQNRVALVQETLGRPFRQVA